MLQQHSVTTLRLFEHEGFDRLLVGQMLTQPLVLQVRKQRVVFQCVGQHMEIVIALLGDVALGLEKGIAQRNDGRIRRLSQRHRRQQNQQTTCKLDGQLHDTPPSVWVGNRFFQKRNHYNGLTAIDH
ncbi:MAG: hypothetical protein CTY11_06375 [Methylomonas sp.]|nr:MAG: hypothetical protein CTY11_06375 [Methylomonas sp.]